jgi:CheY-like chemotaxis protein
LAIAYKYSQILQGNIEVSSIPDKGSIFTLVVPLRFEETKDDPFIVRQTNQSLAAPANGKASPAGKTIMIVEDSEAAIIQLKDFLEDAGFTTIIAHNGAEALTLLEESLPDGIILDLMMPEFDGFTVLKTIRESEMTVAIPVMILTAKHISSQELSFLTQNNIHQLIYKGDISKSELLTAVIRMIL